MNSYLVLSYKDFLDTETNLILSKVKLKKLEQSGVLIGYNVPMYFNFEGRFPVSFLNTSVKKFRLFDFEFELVNYSKSRIKGIFGNLELTYSFSDFAIWYTINGTEHMLHDKEDYGNVNYLAHVNLTLASSSVVNFGYKTNKYKISYKGMYIFDAECFIFGVFCVILNKEHKTEALGVMLDCRTGKIDLGVLLYNKNYRLAKVQMLKG